MRYVMEAVFHFMIYVPVLLILLAMLWFAKRKYNIKVSALHVGGSLLFCFVLICMLSVTGALDILELRRYFLVPGNYHRLNLQPLQRGYEDLSYDNVMNFYLFIPFGVLLPMLWNSYRNVIKVVCTGFIFSAAIEISQWFNYRATDIDDLIMNTLGTAAGYLIYTIVLRRILPKLSSDCRLHVKSRERSFLWRHEGTIYILSAWFFMFFIKPFIKRFLF